MNNGGKHDAGHTDDSKTTKNGVAALEQLPSRGAFMFQRTHPTEQHGGIEKRIFPLQTIDPAEAKHARKQANGDGEKANANGRCPSPEEDAATGKWLGVMLEHLDSPFDVALANENRVHQNPRKSGVMRCV